MANVEIQNYVINLLNLLNLSIVKTQNILISSRHIELFWGASNNDPVLRNLFYIYFENKILKLIIVEGEDAIAKITKIKTQTRMRYIRTLILNCFHAPRDHHEYNRHMKALVEDINVSEINENTKIDLSHIENICKFSRLCEIDYYECAVEIANSDFSYLQPYEKKLNGEKYLLYLHKASVKKYKILYIAAAIYEFIPKIKFSEAYMLCGTAIAKNKALLMCSNNEQEVHMSYKTLLNEGLSVSIESK